MEIELIEIREFVGRFYPFDTLPEESLDKLVSATRIDYLRRGHRLGERPWHKDCLYMPRTGAIEITNRRQELLSRVAEGDCIYFQCEFATLDEEPISTALEDSLVYIMPCDVIRHLMQAHDEFRHFFSASIRERLRHAVRNLEPDADYAGAGMAVMVNRLLRKTPVQLPASVSLKEAAQHMTTHRVSSIMLTDEENRLIGLITDRDLRIRCVADGADTRQPAQNFMTGNPLTIQHDSLLLHAMTLMTRHGIHHLPVMKQDKVAGMITSTDIAHYHTSNPALLSSQIKKAETLDDLVKHSQRIADLQVTLANARISARHVGEIISSITDSITIRLIELAREKLGPEPVPFAWVAGGSQARLEQTAHTDQDNALLISPEFNKEHRDYFRTLAREVNDGLNACGYIYCPGDAMASNDKWRKPLPAWMEYFDHWMQKPEPEALLFANIFFDLRTIYGENSLLKQLQDHITSRSVGNNLFLSHMAANALTHKPPLGFFRKLVLIQDGDHNDTLDIKLRGTVPITDIARVIALAEGITEVNTHARLAAAAGTPSLGKGMSENLQDALELIASLRIRHQAKQISRNQAPDNYLSPASLSDLERKHLKYAFSLIQDMQEELKMKYNVGQLG